MFPKGPACTSTGVFSSVCSRFGLIASRMITVIAPAAWSSSAVIGLPSVVLPMTIRPKRRRMSCSEVDSARTAITSDAAVMSNPVCRMTPSSRWPSPTLMLRITRQVQVEKLHRHHLAVASARGAALDAKGRAHRRLANGHRRGPSDAGEGLAESDRGRRLAFAERRRRDRRHHDVLRLRPVGELFDRLELDLGHIAAVRLEEVRADAHARGDLGHWEQPGPASDLEIWWEGHRHVPALLMT